jgi:hypothetical protein
MEASERNAGTGVNFFGFARGCRIMTRADEYRQYAAECLRVAQELSSSEEKGRLLAMAQKWRELAEQAEGDEKS